MKALTFVLSLAISSAALAEEPAELVKLRSSWENSVNQVQVKADAFYREEMNNINRLYHEKLKQMKDNFMEAKNLQGANSVDVEIKKLIDLYGKQRFETPELQEKASPWDGVWVRYAKGKRSLFVLQGGKFCGPDGGVGSYKLQNGMIEIGMSSWRHRLNVNHEKPDLLEGKNKNGAKVRYERFKF